MSRIRLIALGALCTLVVPSILLAQQPPPVQDVPELEDPPPADLAAQEEARSRMCVPGHIQLAEVDRDLAPLARRVERIGALHNAVTVEDSDRVAPFDEEDPLEVAVREWFEADRELALQYADTGSDSLLEERNGLRQGIRERLEQAYMEVNGETQEILGNAGRLNDVIRICDGAILVRSVVLEVCETVSGAVCDAVREAEPTGRFRFVDDAVDLWDIEQLRPWSQPIPLQPSPDGGLGGARTSALVRRGNVTLVVGVEPLIQARTEVTEELATEFDANLEALGIPFRHQDFVMAPAFSVELHVPGPLAGETHYLLHFGDLSNPETDLLWASEVEDDGFFQAAFPAPSQALERLAAGEEVYLTAVRPSDEAAGEGQPVFSLDVPSVGQAQAVATLLSYMLEGGLSDDFVRFVPPSEEEGA